MNFVLFCFASVGLTTILVHGTIFQSFRAALAERAARIRRRREKKNLPPSFTLIEFLHELIGCSQCCGFWCGLFCGFFYLTSDTVWLGYHFWFPRFLFNRFLMLLCCGLAGSFLAFCFDILAEYVATGTICMKRRLAEQEEAPAEETGETPDPEAAGSAQNN